MDVNDFNIIFFPAKAAILISYNCFKQKAAGSAL